MEHVKEILVNPLYASIVIFVTQILMSCFRTLNIILTTEDNLWGAVITNNAVSITWLLSMTIGLNSMLTGQWQPIIVFLIGGTIGTYIGIKIDKHYKKLKHDKGRV